MAPSTSKIHFRSISLPTRLHPINPIQNLDSCISGNAPITSEAIQSGLLRLAELYSSQNRSQDRKSIEESLESSAHLLDSCTTIRELVQMIRESAQALQSALRRKGVTKPDVNSYFCIRKKMNKSISKSLKALKCLENKTKNGSRVDEVTMAIAIFRSSLVFLAFPAGRSGGLNLISRLTRMKSADCGVVSEVDYALNGLRHGDHQCKDVQRSLHDLDACAEGIEDGLQRLFRQLLQSRVTLLNILTNNS